MSDDADLAQDRLDVAVAASLTRIDATIPAGVAGECDDCGETMPRLVAGRCGFCRDGRRPPLSIFDRLPVAPITSREEASVPELDGGKYVSAPCTGETLTRIERCAVALGISLGRAALHFIELGIEREDDHVIQAVRDTQPGERSVEAGRRLPEPEPARPSAVVDLTVVPIQWLTDEFARRLDASASVELLDAAKARAEASEGQLATLREQLRGLLGAAA